MKVSPSFTPPCTFSLFHATQVEVTTLLSGRLCKSRLEMPRCARERENLTCLKPVPDCLANVTRQKYLKDIVIVARVNCAATWRERILLRWCSQKSQWQTVNSFESRDERLGNEISVNEWVKREIFKLMINDTTHIKLSQSFKSKLCNKGETQL